MSENRTLDDQLTRDEYRILVDLIKHQHQRRQDFNRTFLTANTIIFGASAVILQSNTPMFQVLKLLGGLGILISIVWFLISERITLEADLRFFQLRGIDGIVAFLQLETSFSSRESICRVMIPMIDWFFQGEF